MLLIHHPPMLNFWTHFQATHSSERRPNLTRKVRVQHSSTARTSVSQTAYRLVQYCVEHLLKTQTAQFVEQCSGGGMPGIQFHITYVTCDRGAVPRGSLLMIVGPVGSGKSTLVKTMLGDVPCEAGSVHLRGRVAYVPQQANIFNATVESNILPMVFLPNSFLVQVHFRFAQEASLCLWIEHPCFVLCDASEGRVHCTRTAAACMKIFRRPGVFWGRLRPVEDLAKY